jgi:hypothetical protein
MMVGTKAAWSALSSSGVVPASTATLWTASRDSAFQPAERLVFVPAQVPIVPMALVESAQRECQQGKRVTGAGVFYHGLNQSVVEP